MPCGPQILEKSINNTAYCYMTCNCHYCSVCPFAFLSLTNWWVQTYFTGGITKRETEVCNWEPRWERRNSFGVDLLSYFGGVCLIKRSAWLSELSCNLSVIKPFIGSSKFLLRQRQKLRRKINSFDSIVLTAGK